MKKLLKSKKALSPVVAAIILIAVTVAVSIAVAAWMGSLTFTFMETEELKITSVNFSTVGTNGWLNVTVMNTGTTDVSIVANVAVSGYQVTGGTTTADTVGKGDTYTFDIDLGTESWVDGKVYTVELLSTKGNKFTYTETAPA
jgi:flagellin-like protein